MLIRVCFIAAVAASLAMPGLVHADPPAPVSGPPIEPASPMPAGTASAVPDGPASHAYAPAGPAGTTPHAPPPPVYTLPPVETGPGFRVRQGWFLGADLGTGVASYNSVNTTGESYGATFFALRFGGMLGRRFALSAELWGDAHSINDASVSQACFAIAMTHWLTPRFWIKAGLGTATLRIDPGFDEPDSYDSGVFMMGAGYEALSRDRYALNISASLYGTRFEDEFAVDVQRTSFSLLNVGLNWY